MNVVSLIISILFLVQVSSGDTCLNKVRNTANISKNCAKQLEILCGRHDILFTLWDSSSRLLPSGLTGSVGRDLGNYELCLRVDETVDNVTVLGKFCPYRWGTAIPKNILQETVVALEILPGLVSGDELNNVDVPAGKNLTGSESEPIIIVGSLCIPDACTPTEFVKIFTPYPVPIVNYNIRNYDCVTKHTRRDLTTFEWIVTICLGLVVLAVLLCTCVHVWMSYTVKGEPHDAIKAFSMLYNGTKLITISTNKVDQIQCMNGMRFLSMLWIIAGHSYVSYESYPVLNKQDGFDWKNKLYSQYIQSAVYAVDTFFFLSGFLLAYGYFKQAKNMSASKLIKGVPLMYLHRYLRLTPALAAMILTSVSVLKLMGDGPLWFITYDTLTNACREGWWRYILYIYNYYPADQLCWTQTWYLAADMQMFILAPIILIPSVLYFNRKMRLVISGLSALIVVCVAITIGVRYLIDDYSNDYDTHSRLSAYLVGIIGGMMLHRNKGKHIKINKIINLIIWIVVFGVMLFLALYLFDVNQHPTKDKTIFFSALYRPIWALCILWIVFACYFGYGGFVDWFLSNPLFQIGARLSYSLYIVHAMVIMVIVGEVRTYVYFSDYQVYYQVCGNIVTCIFVSLFWTFTFEGPMILFDKMLFNWIGSLMAQDKTKKVIA